MEASEQSRFDTLYAQHLRALKLQGKAPKTVDGYTRAVRHIATFFDRSPDQLSIEDLKTYFAHLIDQRSWGLVKITRCGIEVLLALASKQMSNAYRYVLQKTLPWIDMLKPPKVQSLPDVLTLEEIARIVSATRERRYQTFCLPWQTNHSNTGWTTYSLGLRLGEALNLQVRDIDAARGLVHIRAGKGLKDRFVVLPSLTLACLRRYWQDHRHPTLLFPGNGTSITGAIDRGSTQKAFARVIADCKIKKHVSIHSLRHAYVTHLIEVGLNLRGVQELLGHSCPKTTARYVHMTRSQAQVAEGDSPN